jgi:N-acetyl-1-D-myo-inositol-2-amino-2-deoxy-alpha-D-glucopyranoside deacetylase
MPEPDFARMPGWVRVGTLVLCLVVGAALGFIGTFFHQSLAPLGVILALGTVAVFLAGLRSWASVRGPAAVGALGVAGMSALLGLPAGGTVLVPANVAGYAWTFGVALIALVVLAWPDTAGLSRSRAVSMEGPAEERETTVP